MIATAARIVPHAATARKPTKQPVPLLKHQPARTHDRVAIAAHDNESVTKHVM